MASKVRRSARLTAGGLVLAGFGLALTLMPTAAVADPTPSTAPGSSITVEVPLAPGTYEIVIRGGDGKEITTKGRVAGVAGAPAVPGVPGGQPGQESAVTPLEPAASGESSATTPLLLTALVLALLALGGFLYHNRILVPRRSIREYTKALAHFTAGRYEQALPEMTRLESTLPARQRAGAKFFICFALYRLENLDEAEHRLAALHREDPAEVNVAYLLAHIRVERRDYDGAEKVLEAIEPGVRLGSARVRKLFGVVKFHRALAAFRDGRIDAAADLFETVERLGDFRDRIPADLRNRHIVLGTRALFEKNLREARAQFHGLEQAAQRADAKQRDPMLASSKLGLALAAWIEDGPDSPSEVEAHLVEAAILIDPAGPLAQNWPAGSAPADLAARLAALAEGEGRTPEQRDRDRTLRDIHFLRGLARLRSWAAADRATALAAAQSYQEEVLSRLACARERDPDFSDVYLVVGLLRYYLATTEPERTAGAALLKEAQKLGTRDPEVIQLVNHHDRRQREYRDAVDAYLSELDRYLRNPTVRDQVRADLRRRMSRYEKVRDWDSRFEPINVRRVPPTVAEMNDRSRLLAERIVQLIATQPEAEGLAAAHELTALIENQAQVLSEHARRLEENEAKLLVTVGDHLLSDDEG